MPEPKLGSAAVKVTIDKAQVAAEAKAAIVPAVQNAGAEASKTLSSSLPPGIAAMLNQNAKASQEAAAAAATQRAEAAALNSAITATGDGATKAAPKIRGLGAAASSMGEAFGGGAAEATRLASVLAYGGIAGAVAIGVAKIAQFGESLNETELDMRQLIAAGTDAQKLLSASGPGFGDFFEGLNVELNQLAEKGAVGIGVLENLRDAAVAAGDDTKVLQLDIALEDAKTNLQNLDNAQARGEATMRAWGVGADVAAEAARRLADAARDSAAAANTQASAATSLITSQNAVISAHRRVQQAEEALSKFGTEASGKSIREARDEAQAVEDAAHRIEDAKQKVIDAEQKVGDAREALAHAGEHELLDVQQAQDEVLAAQRKVNASTPENREEAQHALDRANQKLVDAKRALDEAKPDAERAFNDALRDLSDATYDAERANEDLIDAQLRQNESAQEATRSQGDYQAAVDAVTQAQLDEAEAVAHQRDLMAELATGIKTGPVEQLGHLKEALNDLKDQLDPDSELAKRIMFILASLTPEGAQQIIQSANSAAGGVRRFAAGGTAYGLFEAGEGNNAELVTRHGLFSAPPGGVDVYNPRETRAILSGGSGPREVHHHSYSIVVQAIKEPAERAIRRELDRITALAGG